MKKFMTLLGLTTLVLIAMSTTVFASSVTPGSMGDFATSYGMTGTSDVYYSAPWLVRFVQFFISWTCIIAFLTYYMSYLCSIVVLSNKELFYTIDSLKRDKDGGSEGGNKGPLNGLFEKFKGGSAQDGLNGGADNIAVFFLMLSLNFKAYSVYKNVEAGSEGGASDKGPKYAYSDTMTSFFLKSLFESVMVTFILSIALSGLLIKMWFTVGDVLIVKADRFAQTTLIAKLDNIVGNDSMYTFTLGTMGTTGGDIAQQVSRKLYANILAQFPEITSEQAQSIGKAVENTVYREVLGSSPDGYERLLELANRQMADARKLSYDNIATPEAIKGMSISNSPINSNELEKPNELVIPLQPILDEAGVRAPMKDDLGLYMHLIIGYNINTANNYMVDN